MIKSEIMVEVSYKWWLIPYLNTLLFFCYLFNSEPDYEKLDKILKKALRQDY